MRFKFLLLSCVVAALGSSQIATAEPDADSTLYKRYYKEFKSREAEKAANRDWAQFYRYEKANELLAKAPKAVLMGNSITDFWAKRRPDFFTKYNLAGRGISGQTSSQMLVRFQSDVVDLRPEMVVILAGTNDIALNNGKITLKHVFQNIVSMCQIAKFNGIEPVIASILPASTFSWRKDLKPADDIKELNRMLADYAKENGIKYVDYYSALTDAQGGLPEQYSKDGVHPNVQGYEVMERVICECLGWEK